MIGKIGKYKIVAFLLVILTIALFFRFWQISSVPPGLYPDEAINGNDGLNTLQNKSFKLFYPENNGREGLYYWLLAFSFALFGPGIWSLRFVSALFGTLTVLGIYLLTKELFFKKKNARQIALLAAFFLAVSFWHINFSRIAFRAILIPFIMTFGFYFFLKGFSRKKSLLLIISGLFFGLGFYTYISYRFIVFLGIAVLIPWFFIYKKEKLEKKFLLNVSFLAAAAFIIALPIGLYFLANPGDFFGRAAGVSILKTDNPLLTLAKSIIAHLAMFNFSGDSNWRHNFAGSPQLFWPVGLLFLFGLILSIKDLIVSFKKKDYSLFAAPCLLLSWFVIMLFPGFLSAEGIPHSLRVISVIPVVYIFSALAGWRLIKKIKNSANKNKTRFLIAYLSLSLFFAAVAYAQFERYFFQWAKNPNVEGAFTKKYLEIGNYINGLSDNMPKYVIVNESGTLVPLKKGIPMPAQTPIFAERSRYGKTRAVYLRPENLNQAKPGILIFMKEDKNLFGKTIELFPNGKFKQIKEFWIYKINNPPQSGGVFQKI